MFIGGILSFALCVIYKLNTIIEKLSNIRSNVLNLTFDVLDINRK